MPRLALLAALAYFVTARLSYAFAIGAGTVTLWAPSGVTLALLLINPSSRWLWILAGAAAGSVISDLLSGYSIPLALLAAAANIFESFVAARVVTALPGPPVTLTTLRSVAAFVAGGAIAANAATAMLGAVVLVVGFGMPALQSWFVWWVGDGLGMLVVTPLLVTLSHALRARRLRSTLFRTETALALTLTAGISIAALGPRGGAGLHIEPYIVFPFLFWAALRIGPLGAATATVVVAAVSAWFAALGQGPFVAPGVSEWVTAVAVYLFLAVASVSGLIAAAAIEERRMAEAQLRESEERYRRAQKLEAVGRLAGGIAHDFNNILTVIQGNCDLLADAVPAGGQAAEDIGEIRAAATRAAALTHQLLAFSRRQRMAPRALRLHEVLDEIAPMLRRLIGQLVQIEIHAAPSAPVMADRSQLEQVIVNLALNARDAMPDGGTLGFAIAEIELPAAAAAPLELDAGPYVRMEVTDTGTGIPADAIEHLFEPFYTTKAEGQGTGLGLATVHGIVRQSGGAIDVKSVPGRGTTFSIFFPRARPEIV